MNEKVLGDRLARVPFYHTIPLTPTLATPGWPTVVPIVNMTVGALRSLDLRGKRVLDIGCRDGLFCFEAENLGAAEVIGIDNDLTPGVPEFLISYFKSKVRLLPMNLYDLRPESFGTFDVVVFPGVLYHLRYPFEAIKLVRDLLVEGGTLVLETAVHIDHNRHAMLHCPINDESPYEPTSCTFFNVKGLKDTLESFGLRVRHDRLLLNLPPLSPDESAAGAKPPIDRCSMVCTYQPLVGDAATVCRYWEGKNRDHDLPSWNGKRERKKVGDLEKGIRRDPAVRRRLTQRHWQFVSRGGYRDESLTGAAE